MASFLCVSRNEAGDGVFIQNMPKRLDVAIVSSEIQSFGQPVILAIWIFMWYNLFNENEELRT